MWSALIQGKQGLEPFNPHVQFHRLHDVCQSPSIFMTTLHEQWTGQWILFDGRISQTLVLQIWLPVDDGIPSLGPFLAQQRLLVIKRDRKESEQICQRNKFSCVTLDKACKACSQDKKAACNLPPILSPCTASLICRALLKRKRQSNTILASPRPHCLISSGLFPRRAPSSQTGFQAPMNQIMLCMRFTWIAPENHFAWLLLRTEVTREANFFWPYVASSSLVQTTEAADSCEFTLQSAKFRREASRSG